MYLIHNEAKSVIVDRFITILKTKIYKYRTSVSKHLCINKLDDVINEYNNTCHRTINMKSVDIKDNTYIDSMELHSKEVNNKDPKFKVGDHVRFSKYKNIFAKGYTPNWSEEVLRLKKLKIQFHGHMVLMISMVKKLLENCMKKNYINHM